MDEYIKLLGYIPDARQCLKAFDLFVLPSHKEGMPYVLLEAGAAALPVIAARVGGIPELIENEKNGLLIDPNDTSTISTALGGLASSLEKRTRLGRALHTKVLRDFSLHAMRVETRAYYE